MKIYFRVAFKYKWNNHSNIKCHAEELTRLGYEVKISSAKEEKYNPSGYDLVMIHGSGAFLTSEEYNTTKIPVYSFAWSSPNMFNINHYTNCDKYFTNDLTEAQMLSKLGEKEVIYYQTSCYKSFHRNLNLPKTTDILVYGVGKHPCVTHRNKVVNNLRDKGFKIKVFGRSWDSHSDSHPFLEGEGLIREINKAHLVLDISNETTAFPHRVFESSACSTPCLTMSREDTFALFEPLKELLVYNHFSEIESILPIILADKGYLRKVGLNAQKRCYEQHEVKVRIKQLLPYLEGIK